MSRPRILTDLPAEVLHQITQRSRWTPVQLAGVLGCRPSTVYRLFPGGGTIPAERVLALIRSTQETARV